jgi:HSP20 family molecular chaperone IbpA
MRGTTLEMMHDHVRSIHRTVTGKDPPEQRMPESAESPSPEQVAQHFAELEAIARANPIIAERVPPFSFAPPFDLIHTEREVILELGVPGIDRTDVDVDVDPAEQRVTVSGARATNVALDGRVYLHAEMPRGPFRREIRLPEPTTGQPRVEVENGVIRIRLTKMTKTTLPQA